MNYVRDYEKGLEYLEHLDGVDWYKAPPPPRRHRCYAQTRGFMRGGYVERCPCGGVGFRDGIWIERNQRVAPGTRRWWQVWRTT